MSANLARMTSPESNPTAPPPPGLQPIAPSPYGSYNPAPQTNTMAILSLVFTFVVPILGIIFGYMAKKQIRERGEGGAGLAKAGLILGYIFAVLSVLWAIAVFALLNSNT